ncbi:putative recombinase [Escherichia coli]|nr:putative recombinase [Escherichia coli]
MNNVIPLQNSPERVSLLPIAPGVDFATALSLRRMATSTGATPAYLLAPEVSALLFYMPDQRHHMLFATLWNTGMRIGEARMLTRNHLIWMVQDRLCGSCPKKCVRDADARQKMKSA